MTAPTPASAPETSAPVIPSELEFAGSQRTLTGWEKTLFYWLCAGFTAFHLIVLNVFPIDSIILRAVHLGQRGDGFGFSPGAGAANGHPARRLDAPGGVRRLRGGRANELQICAGPCTDGRFRRRPGRHRLGVGIGPPVTGLALMIIAGVFRLCSSGRGCRACSTTRDPTSASSSLHQRIRHLGVTLEVRRPSSSCSPPRRVPDQVQGGRLFQ